MLECQMLAITPLVSIPTLLTLPLLQDSEDVQRVCRGLQRALRGGLLQDRRLLYKPDVYTHLGICECGAAALCRCGCVSTRAATLSAAGWIAH